MTLKEFIDTSEPDKLIYVGSGSAFFAVGYKNRKLEYTPKSLNGKKKKTLIYDDLRTQLVEFDKTQFQKYEEKMKVWESRYKVMEKEGGEDKKQKPGLETLIDNPMSVFSRRVVQFWERNEEEAVNVKVEGTEIGKIWSIHEGDDFHINYGEEEVAGAAVSDVVSAYERSLWMEIKTLQSLMDTLESCVAYSRAHELYIRYICGKDDYIDSKGKRHRFPNKLFMANPDGVIRFAKKEFVSMMMEEQKKEKKKKETP